MNKFKLDIDYDYDFVLIGISCHETDYRICWAINNELGFDFKRTDDLEIKDKKLTTFSTYSLYAYHNDKTYMDYYIIENRSDDRLLIPEQKQTDFFMVIKGNILPTEKEELVKKLKNISFVLAVYEIDPNQLKSKQNLLF